MKPISATDQPPRSSATDDTPVAGDETAWERLAVLSHKINNPLTSLLGRAQLLRQRPNTDPYVARAAEVIEECSRRIAEHLREISTLVKLHRADRSRVVERKGDESG